MPCKYRWQQLINVTGAMRELSPMAWISETAGYAELGALQSQLISQVVGPFPRVATMLRLIIGLSPGSVRVWHDTENGWFAEGRVAPGAPPVYHKISVEEARALLKEKPDPSLAHRLMQPDTYAGE